ncbi:MAG: PAS domain S-box protein [Thermoanaerobaculia bacterium]
MALVNVVLMTIFVVNLVVRQRRFLLEESLEETRILANTLAVNSSSWVLANDVVGLEELIRTLERYPDMRYAMVVSRDGRVLAHTDESKRGWTLTDEPSLAMLHGAPEVRIVFRSADLVDVASPVRTAHGECIGWARVGLGHGHVATTLATISRSGALYILLAVAFGSISAILIGNRLTASLTGLLKLSAQVRDGRRDVRAKTTGGGEVAELGRGLNEMLDALAAGEERVRIGSLYARSLIEASLDPLVTISPDGKITDVNVATETATGRKREELVDTDFSDYFTQPDKARDGYRKVLADGTVRDYPLTIRNASGGSMDVLYNATVYRNEAGEVQGVFAAARDVTERKAAEQAKEQYLRFFRLSLDPMAIADPFGCFTAVSPAFLRLTGYSESELLSKPFLDFVVPEDRERTASEMKLQVSTRPSLNFENRYLCKGGRVVLLSWTAFFDKNDGVTYATARDITERKRAEAERHAASQYARSLIEASLDPLVTISPDGKITDVNAATETVTGRKREELVGTDFSDYFTEPDKAHDGYRKVLADGTVRDYPLTIRNASGGTTDVLYNATVYQNEAGAVVGVFAAARDITEKKRTEDEIRRLNEDLERRVRERTAELESANRELEAFSYSVSHDLRAPLRAIDGFSRIVTEDFGPQLPPEAQGHLARVRQNARQMGLLVDDLLRFSRLSRQAVQRQAVQPAELVKAVLQELGPEMAGRRIEIEVGALPPCKGDSALLKQVWTNLLSNAIKFTRRRDVARIEVGALPGDGRPAYFIRDNGVGFDTRYVGKLFGVFQRLHSAEEYEGTGVGLAIVQRIVHRHGGKVWAEAALDKGAAFYFTLEDEEPA